MNRTEFLDELRKLKPGATFLSVHGYQNAEGEVSDYSLCFQFSYPNALERSIRELQGYQPEDDWEEVAKVELLESFAHSLSEMSRVPLEDKDDGYARFEGVAGVKLHEKSDRLHLFGQLAHKRVRVPGKYKEVRSKPLTRAKNKLRLLLPVSRWRQYVVSPEKVQGIVVQGLGYQPPTQ